MDSLLDSFQRGQGWDNMYGDGWDEDRQWRWSQDEDNFMDQGEDEVVSYSLRQSLMRLTMLL